MNPPRESAIPPVESDRKSIWQAASDFLFGYDFFISYAHADGASYADALAQSLKDRGFQCFIDEERLAGGDNWRWIAQRALKTTSRLILVASPAAVDSGAVLHEVETYSRRGRQVIPIDFEGTLPLEKRTSGLLAYITPDVIRVVERRARLGVGPTPEAIERICKSFELRRQSQRRTRWLVGAASLFLLLAIVATVLGLLAEQNRRAARDQAIKAEERAREAEVSRENALAAQNFAESQRAEARSRLAAGSTEAQALSAVVPKFLNQSKRHLTKAAKLSADLEAWRKERVRPAPLPERVFTLEAFRAEHGDSFLLLYGDPVRPKVMLFDGGPRGVYRNVIKPHLNAVRERWFLPGALPIELLVSTQPDDDKLRGLFELLQDLGDAQRNGGSLPLNIGALWSSVSLPTALQRHALLAEWPKSALPVLATRVGIPVNQPFSNRVSLSAAGVPRVTFDGGLSITVLGPPTNWLERYEAQWLTDLRRRIAGDVAGSDVIAALEQHHRIVEDFASDRIELVPSPIEIREIPIPSGRERSLANLASLVLMIEHGSRKMLLPSDARDDVLLSALAQAGYTDERGEMWVDLLVLPHSGSANNVSLEFFRRVRSCHYLISTNGSLFKHPDIRALKMLIDARRHDGQPFKITLTYEIESYPHAEDLKALFASEKAAGANFEVITPDSGAALVRIDLESPLGKNHRP